LIDGEFFVKKMMVLVIALLSGLVFGLGLILSGMINPAIVLAFLDVAGQWNSSLLWVMGGAMSVSALAFYIIGRRNETVLGIPVSLSKNRSLDKRLIVGSLLFGAGWGLAGFCPGPALVMAGTGNEQVLLFVAAMLAGMMLFEIVDKKRFSVK